MKKLTIAHLFCGYADIKFPECIDPTIELEPTLTVSDNNEQKLLFLTDKVNGDNPRFDALSLRSLPYAIVVSDSRPISNSLCPIIRVKDVRTALSFALSNFYGIDYTKLKFVGVTGTNGKTTTSTLIYKILKKCGYKCGFIGTGNIISVNTKISSNGYSMTTPDPTVLYPSIARMQSDGCEYIVMEVSSHSIALGKIAPIRFEYAIFTNLDNDHLDFHKTKEDYYEVKVSLFKNADHGLFNLDDKYSRMASQTVKCKKSTFGIINQADAYITEIYQNGLEGSSFFYRDYNLIMKIKTKLIGAFNVYNILAALKCVIDLGIKPCLAKRALEQIESIDGRMEIIDADVMAVIDYAHTPMAFNESLKTIKSSIRKNSRLIVVFGCGGDRDKTKRPIFGQLASLYSDYIIVTEDNNRTEAFSSIAKDITSGITNTPFEIIADRETAIRYAFEVADSGDAVALIGKGHEKYKITNNSVVPFDEREIIKNAMKERNINSYES